MKNVIDERIAAILMDWSRFEQRVRELCTEAAQAGDKKQVRLCKRALGGDDDAVEECARVLAETEAQS